MTEDEILATHLNELGLSNRARNSLLCSNVSNIGEVIKLIEEPARLVAVPNFGVGSFEELRAALSRFGVTVNGNPFFDGKQERARAKRAPREPGTSVYLTKSQIESLLRLNLSKCDGLSDRLLAAIPKAR